MKARNYAFVGALVTVMLFQNAGYGKNLEDCLSVSKSKINNDKYYTLQDVAMALKRDSSCPDLVTCLALDKCSSWTPMSSDKVFCFNGKFIPSGSTSIEKLEKIKQRIAKPDVMELSVSSRCKGVNPDADPNKSGDLAAGRDYSGVRAAAEKEQKVINDKIAADKKAEARHQVELMGKRADYDNQIEAKKSALAKEKSRLTECNKKVSEAKAEKTRLESELSKAQTELTNLNLSGLESGFKVQAAAWQKYVRDVVGQSDEKAKDYTYTGGSTTLSWRFITSDTSELNEIQDATQKMSDDLDKAKSKKSGLDSTISSLNSKISAQQKIINGGCGESQTAINNLTKEISNLEVDKSKLK